METLQQPSIPIFEGQNYRTSSDPLDRNRVLLQSSALLEANYFLMTFMLFRTSPDSSFNK